MTGFSVTAHRLAGGGPLVLSHLTDLVITAARSSPAVSMKCTAVVDALPGELGEVTVQHGGTTLFRGRVDQQTNSIGKEGRLVRLEARSKGALLLDNEALPCALANVGLSTVFSLFAAPYGFVLHSPAFRRNLALYTVGKGLCEWEALGGYVQRVYGHSPCVVGDQIFIDRPPSGPVLVIGDGGVPYCQLEHAYIPYRMVSKVVLRGQDGRYASAVHNPSAAYYGIQRKRYVIPPNEFMDSAALDAGGQIRRSMGEKERITVLLPGVVVASPGREVRIQQDGYHQHNLLVEESTLALNSSGLTTKLTLISSQYD